MQHGWFWFDTKCVRLFKWNVQLHSVFFLQVYSSWTFIQICSSKYPSDESRIIVLNNRYIETFGDTCRSASANRLWWWSAFIWWNFSTKGWVVTRATATVKLVTLYCFKTTRCCVNPSPTSRVSIRDFVINIFDRQHRNRNSEYSNSLLFNVFDDVDQLYTSNLVNYTVCYLHLLIVPFFKVPYVLYYVKIRNPVTSFNL